MGLSSLFCGLRFCIKLPNTKTGAFLFLVAGGPCTGYFADLEFGSAALALGVESFLKDGSRIRSLEFRILGGGV